MTGLPVTVEVPADLVGLVTIRMNGDAVELHYRPVVDAVPPPRRQLALALRGLARYLEAEADELGQT